MKNSFELGFKHKTSVPKNQSDYIILTSTGSGAVTLRVGAPGGWSLTGTPAVAGLFSKVNATKEPAENNIF
jgi:hypothetical protein